MTHRKMLMTQLNTSSMQPILSLPWTIRRMQSEGNPSHTYDLIRHQPAWFEWASTSSYTCANLGACWSPLSVTTLTPTKGSALSVRWKSSRSSGSIPLGLAQPDLGSTQKTSDCTLSALAEPWPCTSMGSQIARLWTLVSDNR